MYVLPYINVSFSSHNTFQLGTLLGCVIGLKKSVAGITIIALGTSLPDTFASRTAALHDENADAAIGNVTGKDYLIPSGKEHEHLAMNILQ